MMSDKRCPGRRRILKNENQRHGTSAVEDEAFVRLRQSSLKPRGRTSRADTGEPCESNSPDAVTDGGLQSGNEKTQAGGGINVDLQ